MKRLLRWGPPVFLKIRFWDVWAFPRDDARADSRRKRPKPPRVFAHAGVIAEDAPNRTLRGDAAKNPANLGFATIDFAGLS